MSALSYELGKRAHKHAITNCEPMKDKVFMLYLKKYNQPIIVCMVEYVKGYHDRKTRIDADAIARRREFSLV